MLVGRGPELETLRGVLDAARAGTASSLLLVGEPGIGKTALLAAAATDAESRGMAVVSATAVEAESAIAGAGLHLLLSRLGGPRGTGPGSPWDLLTALGAQAAAGPVVLVVDDVQWLDEASLQALGFAVRRLLADPVAVVLAGRPQIDTRPELSHVPRLAVAPLDDDDATALLRACSPRTPPDAARTIARALGGLPLALVEAPAMLPADVMAGRAALEQPVPVGESIRGRFARGFDAIGPGARRALVVAAADDADDARVLARAWALAGVSDVDVQAAEGAGLLVMTPHPTFRHPLARSAVYASVTDVERRDAHRVFVTVYGERGDEPRRLRHAALAALGADDDLAAALEAEARVTARGGSATAAAALAARSADLTSDPSIRWERRVLAAELSPQDAPAGAHARAVLADCGDPVLRARAALVLAEQPTEIGEIASALDGALGSDLPPGLADRVAGFRIYVAMHAADLDTVDRLAARFGGDPANATSWQVCFALGCAYTYRARHHEAHGWLRKSAELTAGIAADDVDLVDLFDWATITGWLGESVPAHRARIAAASRRWRRTGDPANAASADLMIGEMARRDGHWARAMSFWETGLGIEPTAGPSTGALTHRMAVVTAAQGLSERTRAILAAADRRMEVEGNTWERLWVDHCHGLLAVTAGRLEDAAHRLERVRSVPFLGRGCRDAVACSLVLLAEVYASLGRAQDAIDVAAELERRLDGIVDEHGLALVDRAHAVAGTDDPDERFRAALAHHARADEPFERARTALLYGQWLRRHRRPADARDHLREAAAVFESVAAAPWAERARDELAAAGEARPVPAAAPAPALTPQELRIALAVADGMSNADIAATLFLSVKTVEFHLTRVYRKLGVRSRAGVARALADSGLAA